MLIICCTQSKSQIYDCTITKGAGDYFSSNDFRIYIPDTVSTIRGIYCYVHGIYGDSRSIVTDPTFTHLCDETGFALLGVRIPPGADPYFYYEFGKNKSVLRALQYFATQSSHPEIEFAPIFFEGYSWGAAFSYFFTMWKPEVVIGFNPQKIGVDTIDVGEAIYVPGYLIYGEFDSGRDLSPAFEKHRPKGALWTLAMEPGGAHAPITDRNLLDNYFKDVIELRLPTNIIPGQPVVLDTIDESVGWLGDRSTFEIAEYDSFTGDKSQACWLPSQDAAQRWQNFVSGNKSGKISKYRPFSRPKNGPYLHDSSSSPDIMNIKSAPKITNSSNAIASFIGESAGDGSGGLTVVSAGDVNGDGLDDFLIGANYNSENGAIAGQTYLILGRAAADWGMDFNLSQADASFVGEVWRDRSGFSISAAGDVNGDGLNDFLISAPFNDENGSDAGQTYMILGRAAADWGMDFDLSQADASFIGESENDWSGACVSSAGDVNGDGLDDFLIGANGRDVSRTSTLMDFDAGKTYLLLGRATANWGIDFNLSQSDASFTGEASLDRSGFTVSSAGDVNGDGLDDFLIGTLLNDLYNQSAGSNTYLLLGRAAADWGTEYNLSQSNASFLGEKRFDFAGYSVSCAGDINGDGMDDFIIGAYDNSEGGYSAGQSYLVLGKAEADWGLNFNLSQANASFVGESPFDVSGFSVSGAGDVNGDGRTDFIIGAPNNCLGGYFAGSTYLIKGTQLSHWGMDYDLANADAVLIGEMEQDLFGFSVALAGDVDGDGKDDIIIGACYNDEGGINAGQTYLFLGSMIINIAQKMKGPIQFSLTQNYPNPFNPTTRLSSLIYRRPVR
jgi:hypothetical protein